MPPRTKKVLPPEEEKAPETFEITLGNGMKVMVYAATEDQVAVGYKVAREAQKQQSGERAMRAVEVVFRIAEKLLVDHEDAERIEDGMIDGTLHIADVMKLFLGGVDEDAQQAAPPSRVRRASARK